MSRTGPLGAVLAGGAARRMGGASKATALLGGRPLLAWAVQALRDAGVRDVVVVAKRSTELPALDVEVWREPDEPRHPLAGVRHALERAGDRPVLTLPVDVPLIPPAALRELAAHALAAPAVVVRAGGRVQPLVARLHPSLAASLPLAGRAADAILALDPVVLDVPADGFANLNTPADLAAAERALSRRAGSAAPGRP